MSGKRKRPLFWNLRPNPKQETLKYFFLIVNSDKREIVEIKSKIYSWCRPFEGDIITGRIEHLFYDLIMVETYNKEINLEQLLKAYGGRLKKDKNLYDRQTRLGLELYLEKRVKKIAEEEK